MRFKNLLLGSLLAAISLTSMIGCGVKVGEDLDEHMIGTKLEAVSPIRANNGSTNSTVAIFDDRLRKIHQFDVAKMTKLRTLKVEKPTEQHYVLHDAGANYIIDLTLSGFTIFDKNGKAQNNPLRLRGKPKSAAFHPERGFLVLYDDLMTVGIVSIDPNGKVLKAVTLGPILGDADAAISSGDITYGGKLVLSMSDKSLAVVDIDQTLAQNRWVFNKVSTGTTYSWMAPVEGNANRMLVRSENNVALVDITTGATMSQVALNGKVKKLSKEINPHVISMYNGEATMFYTSGGAVRTRTMYRDMDAVVRSQLDLANNEWKVVFGNNRYIYDIWYNEMNIIKDNRHLEVFEVSSGIATENKRLTDNTQIYLGTDFIFTLYPSDLGKIEREDIATGNKIQKLGFNIREY